MRVFTPPARSRRTPLDSARNRPDLPLRALRAWCLSAALASALLCGLTLLPAPSAASCPQDQQADPDEPISPQIVDSPVTNEGFDLDTELEALIVELDPPPLEEILEWFEPIPTVEEALTPLPEDPNAPYQRTLSAEEEEETKSLEKRIEELCEQGQFAEASALAEQLLSIHERAQGETHWASVAAREDLRVLQRMRALDPEAQLELAESFALHARASQLHEQRLYQISLPLVMKALRIRAHHLPGDDSALAASLHDVAFHAAHAGRAQLAEALYRAELAMRGRATGYRSPSVVDALNDLGSALGRAGACSWASKCLAAGTVLRRELLGNEHLSMQNSMYSLAVAIACSGDYIGAERTYRDLLKARRARFGDGHPALVGTLGSLGDVLVSEGKYDEAMTYLREAVAIAERRWGKSPRLEAPLNNLAAAMRHLGQLAQAEQAYRDVLRIERTYYGEYGELAATTLSNLGIVLRNSGDLEGAETLYRDALAIYSQRSGRTPTVARTWYNLSSALLKQGRVDAAEQACHEALEIWQDVLPDDHEDIARSQLSMARILHTRGDQSGAIELLRNAKRICALNPHGDPRLPIFVDMALAECLAEYDDDAAEAEVDALLSEAVHLAREREPHDFHSPCIKYATFLQETRGREVEAAALYLEAITHIEEARWRAGGDELDRARYSSALSEGDPFGGLLRAQLRAAQRLENSQGDGPKLGPQAAFHTLERGCGRTCVDLLARSAPTESAIVANLAQRTQDESFMAKVESIRQRETDARAEWLTAEAQMKPTLEDASLSTSQKDRRVGALTRERDEALEAERQAVRELANLMRQHSDSRKLNPMTAKQVAAELRPRDLLLAYDVGKRDTILFRVDATADVQATTLKWPDQTDITHESLSKAVENALTTATLTQEPFRTDSGEASGGNARDLARVLIPADWLQAVRDATRVLIVPDGPLHQLPFERLVLDRKDNECWIDVGPPIVYGPSGTVIMAKRKWAQEKRDVNTSKTRAPLALVAVGDPVFACRAIATAETPRSPEPEHGVLLATVMPDGNAHASGLRAGDVLLTYDGTRLERLADLGPAIQAAEARRLDNEPRSDRATERRRESQTPARAVMRGGEEPAGQETSSTPTIAEAEPAADHAITTTMPSDRVSISVWRDGQTLELTLAPGKMGVRPSQCSMPTAWHDWCELQLSEDERFVKYASAAMRDGFGETLEPLPGTRAEVDGIARVMKQAGVRPDAVKVLTGEQATLTKLFDAAEKPRFLHLATHGKVESGRRVHESALALTLPEQPTPDDFGFLRLQDLLYKWGGKLEGTELVVLSGCATATGRLEAADGFVGLTWGFLYAGADSVIASLWKVDDAATALLMHRLYENLLGVYEEPRMGFDPGTEMPKAEALHEAKRWLRHQTPAQNKGMLAKLGMNVEHLQERYRRDRGRLPTEDPQTLPEPFDYSTPRFWAAFVLIGDPG